VLQKYTNDKNRDGGGFNYSEKLNDYEVMIKKMNDHKY